MLTFASSIEHGGSSILCPGYSMETEAKIESRRGHPHEARPMVEQFERKQLNNLVETFFRASDALSECSSLLSRRPACSLPSSGKAHALRSHAEVLQLIRTAHVKSVR